MDLQKTKEELIKYSQTYYDGNPLISDPEFDSLYKEYLDKGGEDLGIGAGYKDVGEICPHLITPIGSLDKINIDTLDKSFKDDDLVDVTPKLDGNSSVAYYDKGKLLQAIIRGTKGLEGTDVTKNIIHSIPKTIKYKDKLAVRGEIVLTWEDFKKVGGSDPRSKAGGLVKSFKNVNLEEIKLLKFVAINILNFNISRVNIMCQLEDLGFITPVVFFNKFKIIKEMLLNNDKFFYNPESVIYQIEYNKTILGKIPYDGLVICKEHSRVFLNEKESGWKHYISDCLAFKFKDESKITKIINIEWNLSKTGRMVPLAYIDPINIEGANISKVTLNNYDWMTNREIGIGSEVEVIRANMVIPKIIKVITFSGETNLPEFCPECKSKLELVKCSLTDEDSTLDLQCINENCSRLEKNLFWNLLRTFSPKGVADSTIEDFVNQFNIKSVEDLKDLLINVDSTKNLINKNWKKGYGTLLLKTIDNLNEVYPTIKDILLMSDIKGIGDNSSTRIFENISPKIFINCITNN